MTADDELARFEFAKDRTEHHHHLLCLNGGAVIDITPSAGFEGTIARHLDALADSAGFQPHSHRVDVPGLCAACH